MPGLIADAPALALDLEVKSASNGSLVEAGTYRLCLTLGASDHAPQNYESQLVFQWIVLAAITRFQELTVIAEACESGSEPLIRQLLCSALCSKFCV